MTESAYRSLPSVDALLQNDEVIRLAANFSRSLITTIARDVLSDARSSIKNTGESRSVDQVTAQITQRIQKILNSEMLKLNILASVTGLFVAILTWIFLKLIDLIINVLYLGGDYLDNDLGYWAILIPGIGPE